MKQIVIFTWLTPTEDNFRGPSALIYHILKNRPEDYNVTIYTTNYNKINDNSIQEIGIKLNVQIKIIKDTLYNFFHKRQTLSELRIRLKIDKSYGQSNYKLPNKTICEIEKIIPDLVIIFDENFVNVARQLSQYNLMIMGYDCFPLHYHRLLYDAYCFKDTNSYKKFLFNYKIAIHRELEYNNITCKIAEVGIEDTKYYKTITQRNNVKFLPHPHYSIHEKIINLDKPLLSIIITGKFDVYTYSDTIKLIKSLLDNSANLRDKFKFTFLGSSWRDCAEKLEQAGYNVQLIDWVETYAGELIKHDIQIFPISVGSGTKGKVLNAISMGLLAIGSKYALENIYVKDRHSCFKYNDAKDIPLILEKIYQNRNIATEIANNGRELVLKWHNPTRVSKIFFNEAFAQNDTNTFDGELEYYNVIKTLKPIL